MWMIRPFRRRNHRLSPVWSAFGTGIRRFESCHPSRCGFPLVTQTSDLNRQRPSIRSKSPPIRRPPRKLLRELVHVDAVAALEGWFTDLVLLDVVGAAEADGPAIGGL